MSAAPPIDGGVSFGPVARRSRGRGRPALLILAGTAVLAALAMSALAWLWPHFPPLDWEASAPLWISGAWIFAAAAFGAWILVRTGSAR